MIIIEHTCLSHVQKFLESPACTLVSVPSSSIHILWGPQGSCDIRATMSPPWLLRKLITQRTEVTGSGSQFYELTIKREAATRPPTLKEQISLSSK